MGTELAVRNTSGALSFDPQQRKLIRDTFASGASDQEFAALMAVAERRGLDPFLRQVYFVKRWDSQKRCEVWAVQVSIDGLRGIAQRTGLYDGQDEPEFEYDAKGHVKSCRAKVWRKDWSRPSVVTAHWSEYAQTKKDGGYTAFWAGKPHIMLAKCAEALALRKAFPEDTAGIYIPEEMGQEIDITPEPAPVPKEKKRADPEVVQKALAHVERVTGEGVGQAANPARSVEAITRPTTVADTSGSAKTTEVSSAGTTEFQATTGEAVSLVDKLAVRITIAQEQRSIRPGLTSVAADAEEALKRGHLTQGERDSLFGLLSSAKAAILAGAEKAA